MDENGQKSMEAAEIEEEKSKFLVLDRRSLLMLGLGIGVASSGGFVISRHLSTNGSLPEPPAGFAYITIDGEYLSIDNRLLIWELS